MSFRPQDIRTIGNFYLDGRINGETFSEAEFADPVEAFRIYHSPMYKGIATDKRTQTSGYNDSSRLNNEYEELMNDWRENQNADIYFTLENIEGETMEWELIPRRDIEFSDTQKPFSMMEAKFTPEAKSKYQEPQKLVLRMARRYEEELYDKVGIVDSEGIIPEIDLFTAFDREYGIQQQINRSELEWHRPIRNHYKVIQTDYQSDWQTASETVPMLMNFLPNDLESVGISPQEGLLAAKHIASCHGLNLIFREDREANELMIEFGTRQENLVNIDAEFGIHSNDQNTGKRKQDDYHLFEQQIINLAKPNWREIQEILDSTYEDFIGKVENSEKEWSEALQQEKPENWEKELPQQKFS